MAAHRYTKSELGPGLSAYEGSTEVPTLAALIEKLASMCPAFAIVDFSKVDRPVPEGCSAEYLFDWIPAEVRPMGSPALVSRPTPAVLVELASQTWNKDAFVCLFSRKATEELLPALRAALRLGEVPPPQPPEGLLGYCWPSVFRTLAEQSNPALLGHVLKNVDVALMEAKEPGQWTAYSALNFGGILDRIGLKKLEQ